MHFLPVCLVLAQVLFVLIAADSVRLSDKDLQFKVIRPSGGKFLTLRCSMIPYRTYLSSVSKVEIFAGDDMDGETSKFQRLAVIKNGWQEPKLANVGASEAAATGAVLEAKDETTFLELTWKAEDGGYCKSYECVVTGENKEGNPTTIFAVNRVKSTENKACTSTDDGCFC